MPAAQEAAHAQEQGCTSRTPSTRPQTPVAGRHARQAPAERACAEEESRHPRIRRAALRNPLLLGLTVTDWLVLRPPGKQPSDGGADAEEGEANDVADFLGSLDEYVPIIPDELTNQYLARAGFKCDDVTATRLVSLATQKFVSDIVFDATKVAEQRTRGGAGRGKAATQPKKQQVRVMWARRRSKACARGCTNRTASVEPTLPQRKCRLLTGAHARSTLSGARIVEP